MVKTTKLTATMNELVEKPELSPIPIEVFPNQMGINLASVDYLEWVRSEDGQLLSLEVTFIPSE